MTPDEEVKIKQQLDEIHDALIGTYDKPGALRMLERIGGDMYERDGVMETIKSYKNDRRWVLGAATGIGFGAGAFGAWIKSLFGRD